VHHPASDAYRLSQTLQVASFPYVAVLVPAGSNQLAVVYQRTGPVSADTLIAQLVQTADGQRMAQASARARTSAVAANRQLIAAQDREYKAALEADRAKSEKAKDDERRARERKEQAARQAEDKRKEIERVEQEKKVQIFFKCDVFPDAMDC
jgi:hypothetical protein